MGGKHNRNNKVRQRAQQSIRKHEAMKNPFKKKEKLPIRVDKIADWELPEMPPWEVEMLKAEAAKARQDLIMREDQQRPQHRLLTEREFTELRFDLLRRGRDGLNTFSHAEHRISAKIDPHELFSIVNIYPPHEARDRVNHLIHRVNRVELRPVMMPASLFEREMTREMEQWMREADQEVMRQLLKSGMFPRPGEHPPLRDDVREKIDNMFPKVSFKMEPPPELVRLQKRMTELDAKGHFKGRNCRTNFFVGDKLRAIDHKVIRGHFREWGYPGKVFELCYHSVTPVEIFPAELEGADGMQMVVLELNLDIGAVVLPGYLFELHPDDA